MSLAYTNKQSTPLYLTNKILVRTGYIVQIIEYENCIIIGRTTINNKTKKIDSEKLISDPRAKALYRAKRKVREAINSNAYCWYDENNSPYKPMFLTLTFRENITDLTYANMEYTKFVQRLNYELTGIKKAYIKYVCVVEFQKRGSIHYHIVIFNLPYTKNIYDKLQRLWTNGSRTLKPVNKLDDIGHYLTKYFTKNINDERLKARDSYFVSRGLLKPNIVNIEEAVDHLQSLLPDNSLKYFSDYQSEFSGQIKKTYYNLKNFPDEYKYFLYHLNIYSH